MAAKKTNKVAPKSAGKSKPRSERPIAKRQRYNSKKKAEEAARRAGGGKKPRHDAGGNAPHYHPDVPNEYRTTPHGASSHDHYFYPKNRGFVPSAQWYRNKKNR